MRNGADIQLDGVSRTYHTPGGVAVEVLRNISLSVTAGESIAITGPSGSGKTTLLQLIGALDRPDSGEIRINGRELGGMAEDVRAEYRNREIGFVFQAHHLLPQLTALENVLVPAWARRVNDTHVARATSLLQRVGLGERISHLPSQLSGGEQQRVALARALLLKPILLLADEPTGALDQSSAETLINLLLDLNNEAGTTLLVVTHAEFCAARMQRRLSLVNGKLHNKNNGEKNDRE